MCNRVPRVQEQEEMTVKQGESTGTGIQCHTYDDVVRCFAFKQVAQNSRQCAKCEEVWTLTGLGWELDKNQTIARNPNLKHSFIENSGLTCLNCGIFAGNAIKPCVNPDNDLLFGSYLKAVNKLAQCQSLLVQAELEFKKINEVLPERVCPLCNGEDVICGLCEGRRKIGSLKNES